MYQPNLFSYPLELFPSHRWTRRHSKEDQLLGSDTPYAIAILLSTPPTHLFRGGTLNKPHPILRICRSGKSGTYTCELTHLQQQTVSELHLTSGHQLQTITSFLRCFPSFVSVRKDGDAVRCPAETQKQQQQWRHGLKEKHSDWSWLVFFLASRQPKSTQFASPENKN